ncbi:hypothetical protein M885DRAFT_326378 [Pelagophyceae sp. CCMP2097]|nr:hypothetical protein M885DRAFT_326378 [Pelagophyceae sp. CCMP2097]
MPLLRRLAALGLCVSVSPRGVERPPDEAGPAAAAAAWRLDFTVDGAAAALTYRRGEDLWGLAHRAVEGRGVNACVGVEAANRQTCTAARRRSPRGGARWRPRRRRSGLPRGRAGGSGASTTGDHDVGLGATAPRGVGAVSEAGRLWPRLAVAARRRSSARGRRRVLGAGQMVARRRVPRPPPLPARRVAARRFSVPRPARPRAAR